MKKSITPAQHILNHEWCTIKHRNLYIFDYLTKKERPWLLRVNIRAHSCCCLKPSVCKQKILQFSQFACDTSNKIICIQQLQFSRETLYTHHVHKSHTFMPHRRHKMRIQYFRLQNNIRIAKAVLNAVKHLVLKASCVNVINTGPIKLWGSIQRSLCH